MEMEEKKNMNTTKDMFKMALADVNESG